MPTRDSRSKTQSGASSSSKQPEHLVFFLDRNLGKTKIASALRQAGATVEVHDDHFQPDAKDQDWLASVGARGWIVITKDQRIRYRPLELNALRNAGVGAFILTGGNLRGEEIAELLVNRLPAMKRFVAKHRVPFIAIVGRSGITPIKLS